ncbi:rab11 family-interacting protein 1-like isoform X2 [Heterodontus francisci]|uniref:rab11 family-interacting protein 1-like isoform X2 n=1 Tax=Heterodontus francisci TaxID=7792 RepID=UPI00355C766E
MSLLAQSQKWYPTHVKVVVIQARGLRSKGKDGTNDAYAIMQLGKEKYSSSVAEKSGQPLWREEAEFELPVLLQRNPEKCTLYLIVMHRALVGLDKFLGQATINLSELYERKTRNKVGWYKLQSKTGKKEKERGEIEADIQFVRNSMTASMFDLSVKDKSRSTLGKLKDKLKGKKKDALSDSVSEIIPSISSTGDSDDDAAIAEKKKKSKLRMLFPKSNLQRTSLSQSMSVIPTAPASPTIAKKAKNFATEDFTEIQLHDSAEEESSSKTLYIPKIMSHKRAASADTKQLNFLSGGNVKKDPLSLFGGLKPKSDPVSQSNLCINGSHVYTEEPNQATHGKPKSDSKSLHSSPFYSSAEDLTFRFSTGTLETTNPLSPSKSEPRSSEQTTLAAAKMSGSASDLSEAQKLDGLKEEQEGKQGATLALSVGKKEVGKKPATVSASGAGTKSLNPFEDDKEEEETKAPIAKPAQKTEVLKVEAMSKKEETKRGGLMSLFPRKSEPVKAPEPKESRNPFEDSTEEVKKPASSSVWSSRTAAIKPKLEVSPKAETKAEPLSPSLPSVPPFPPLFSALTDPFSSAPPIAVGTEGSRNSNFASLHVAYSPPATFLEAQSPLSSVNANNELLDSLPPLPSASSSSSSLQLSDSDTSSLSATELVEGKSWETRTPKRESSKTSARALFQELTGKNSTVNGNQWSSLGGEKASASEIKRYQGSSEDNGLEANPKCKLESNEEYEKVSSELRAPYEKPGPADSRDKVSVEAQPLLDLISFPASETKLPRDPPKVPPRSSLPGSEVKLNLEPSFAETQKVPPIPAPRNVNRAITNDDTLHSPEDRPSEDRLSFQRDAECSAELLIEFSKVADPDLTLGVGKPDEDFATSSQKELTGIEEKPLAISVHRSHEGEADDYPVMMKRASHPVAGPADVPVIPEKMEHSTEGSNTAHTTQAASRPKSPVPLVPPAVVIPVAVAQDCIPETKSDLTINLTTNLEHLSTLQLVKVEKSKGRDSGPQEPSVSGHKMDHDGKRKSADQNPTPGNKREGSPMSSNYQRGSDKLIPAETVTKLESSEVSFSTWQSLQKSSEESFGECKLETSKSSLALPPSSTKGAEASPPFSVSPLPRSLSPPPLSQSTSPVSDDTDLIKPPAGSSLEVEHSGQKRLLQAQVSPTETQPIQSQSSASAVPSRRSPSNLFLSST